MDLESYFNLALIFSDPHKGGFETYSQELTKILPGPYILGVNSLPHISVLQFTSTETPEKLWSLAQPLQSMVTEIGCHGPYFEQGTSTNRLWFGIRTTLTEQLMALQSRLKEIIPAQHIINNTGARYFPHITTGCTEPMEQLPSLPFHAAVTMLDKVPCMLALGRSGPQLQFKELLYI